MFALGMNMTVIDAKSCNVQVLCSSATSTSWGWIGSTCAVCLALSDPHVGRVAPKTLVDEVVIQSWSWFAWQKRLVLARRVARYMAKVHSTQDIKVN